MNSNEHKMTDAERKLIEESLREHKTRSATIIAEAEKEVAKWRVPSAGPRGSTVTASPKARFKMRKKVSR